MADGNDGNRPRQDKPPQPWKPAHATRYIREIASGDPDLHLGIHTPEQLEERSLIMGDLLYVLKNGFVYDDPEPSTRPGFFKYRVESSTPNTNGRSVRVVVIPSYVDQSFKTVTIMWRDDVLVGGRR